MNLFYIYFIPCQANDHFSAECSRYHGFCFGHAFLETKDLLSLSSFVIVAAITMYTHHHLSPFSASINAPPSSSSKPKNPQHLFSLLLKHPSKSQLLQQLHSHNCLLSSVVLQNGLLQMYLSWGLLVEAAKVSYQMSQRSLVSWNVFINYC